MVNKQIMTVANFIKKLLLLALIFCLNIYAQVKEIYSTEVQVYMNALKEYTEEYEYMPTFSEFSISKQELDDLLLKMYHAIASDPEGYTNYLGKDFIYKGEQVKAGKMDVNKSSILDFHKLVRSKLEKQYSQKYITIITTPYYLRVKIIDKIPDTYTTDTGYEYEGYLVNVVIEDILKGEQKYKVGEQITFRYFKSNRCIRNYEVGKTYFIPFEVITTLFSKFNGLTPQWFDCAGNYLIENDTLTSYDDYFEIGKDISWDEFKEKFAQKYIIGN